METMGMWLLLTVSSIYDLTGKKIPVLLLGMGGALGTVAVWRSQYPDGIWITAVLPGFCLLLIAFVSGQKIGYGDGFLVLVLGLLEGGRLCAVSVFLALFFISIFSIVLLSVKKATPGSEIPFVPFLLAAHICLYAFK